MGPRSTGGGDRRWPASASPGTPRYGPAGLPLTRELPHAICPAVTTRPAAAQQNRAYIREHLSCRFQDCRDGTAALAALKRAIRRGSLSRTALTSTLPELTRPTNHELIWACLQPTRPWRRNRQPQAPRSYQSGLAGASGACCQRPPMAWRSGPELAENRH